MTALERALEAVTGIERVVHSVRGGERFGVTEREAALYDKGYDDALSHVRAGLALALPDAPRDQLERALYAHDRQVIRWWAETVAEIDPDAFGYPFRPLDEPWETVDPPSRRYYRDEAEKLRAAA